MSHPDDLGHKPSGVDERTQITEVMGPEGGSMWPGDWYVYENGRVDGPLSAVRAFSLSHEAEDGKPRLISRKGFSQWYPLGDLSEIFRLTDDMGRKVAMERQKANAATASEKQLHAMEEQLERFGALKTKVTTSQLSPHSAAVKVAKGSRQDKNASIVRPFDQPEPDPQAEARTSDAAGPVPTSQAARITKNELMTEYFLQRGRMRLGKIRQPWLAGFIGLPLSLGIYWFVWFRDLMHEAAFHSQHHTKLPPPILALVPFVHIYMVYRLAIMVRGMEEQNKYRSVSPRLAAMFALIPPFAVTYLQDCANRHWLLHARHAASLCFASGFPCSSSRRPVSNVWSASIDTSTSRVSPSLVGPTIIVAASPVPGMSASSSNCNPTPTRVKSAIPSSIFTFVAAGSESRRGRPRVSSYVAQVFHRLGLAELCCHAHEPMAKRAAEAPYERFQPSNRQDGALRAPRDAQQGSRGTPGWAGDRRIMRLEVLFPRGGLAVCVGPPVYSGGECGM